MAEGKRLGGGGVSCGACGKTVFAMDKQMSASGVTYHQPCFKCSHCKSQLTISTWSIGDGVLFCKTHYMELFKANGGRYTFSPSGTTTPALPFTGPVTPAEDAPDAKATPLGTPKEAPAVATPKESPPPPPVSVPASASVSVSPAVDTPEESVEGGGEGAGLSVRDRIKAAEVQRKAKEAEEASAAASTAKTAAATLPAVLPSPGGVTCAGCQKRVYAMDAQMGFEGVTYHQPCFKCTHCKSQLTLLTFAQVNGIPYCKAHFMELFMTKGNYDFGARPEDVPAAVETAAE